MGPPALSSFWGGFHHKVARRISGNMPRWRTKGTWELTPLWDATRTAGIREIKTCIYIQQNTLGALNSYSSVYEPMPEYKEEARITETSESAKKVRAGLPRESGGGGGGWRQRPGWIGGSIWGQKYGSRSGKDNGAIHKSQKQSLVLL